MKELVEVQASGQAVEILINGETKYKINYPVFLRYNQSPNINDKDNNLMYSVSVDTPHFLDIFKRGVAMQYMQEGGKTTTITYKGRFSYMINKNNIEMNVFVKEAGDCIHFPIWIGDKHIAEVVRDNKIKNFTQQYTIYCMDEYSIHKDSLELLVIWINQLFYRTSSAPYKIGVTYTHSFKDENKYEPNWIKDNFGE